MALEPGASSWSSESRCTPKNNYSNASRHVQYSFTLQHAYVKSCLDTVPCDFCTVLSTDCLGLPVSVPAFHSYKPNRMQTYIGYACRQAALKPASCFLFACSLSSSLVRSPVTSHQLQSYLVPSHELVCPCGCCCNADNCKCSCPLGLSTTSSPTISGTRRPSNMSARLSVQRVCSFQQLQAVCATTANSTIERCTIHMSCAELLEDSPA